MEPLKLGERVALISKNNVKRHLCYFMGYGIYEGFFEIPYNKKLDKLGKHLAKVGELHHRFKLDDNQIFFDYELWFMPEERFKEVFVRDYYCEGWKVIKTRRKSKH